MNSSFNFQDRGVLIKLSGAVISGTLVTLSAQFGVAIFLLLAFLPLLWVLGQERNSARAGVYTGIVALSYGLVGVQGLVVEDPLIFVGFLSLCFSLFFLVGFGVVYSRRFYAENALVDVVSLVFFWLVVEGVVTDVSLLGGFSFPFSLVYFAPSSLFSPFLSFGGPLLASAAILVVNASLYLLAIGKNRRASQLVLLGGGIWLFANLGFWEAELGGTPNKLRLLYVQGITHPEERLLANYSEEERTLLFERYAQLTASGLREVGDVDMIIWPESAIQWRGPEALEKMNQFTFGGKQLIVGVAHQRKNRVIVGENGQWFFRYDKRHLVPVFEADIKPGIGHLLGMPEGKGVRYGLGICWESLFPEYSRDAVLAGAEFLVYVSNNTFGRGTSSPQYHFGSAAVRAMESQRYTAFVNELGPSGVFDPRGKLISKIAEGERGFRFVEISLVGSVEKVSFYYQWGPWIRGLGLGFFFLVYLVLALERRYFRLEVKGGATS